MKEHHIKQTFKSDTKTLENSYGDLLPVLIYTMSPPCAFLRISFPFDSSEAWRHGEQMT